MKKLRKVGKKAVLRSAKLSLERQSQAIQHRDYFILRADVFDLLGVSINFQRQQQA